MTLFLAIALLTALVTFGGSIIVWKLSLKYRLYPKIRERDVHTRPTPRLGGVAMFVGILVAFGAAAFVSTLGPSRFSNIAIIFQDPGQILAILGAALLIVLVGVADDIWDLDWMTKLAGQFLAAGLIAWQGVRSCRCRSAASRSARRGCSRSLTVFVIVLVMNAVNFIDGLDGLVAGVALIANGVFFVYTYLLVQQTSPTNYFNLASLIAIILVGACAGFLPLNWHPREALHGRRGRAPGRAAHGHLGDRGHRPARPATGVGLQPVLAAFIPILLPFAVLVDPAARLRARGLAPPARRQVAVHRRPQAPAPPPARHGALAPARGADLLRLDGGRLHRMPPDVRLPGLLRISVALGVPRCSASASSSARSSRSPRSAAASGSPSPPRRRPSTRSPSGVAGLDELAGDEASVPRPTSSEPGVRSGRLGRIRRPRTWSTMTDARPEPPTARRPRTRCCGGRSSSAASLAAVILVVGAILGYVLAGVPRAARRARSARPWRSSSWASPRRASSSPTASPRATSSSAPSSASCSAAGS